mmetsp:Transcript_4851/g.5745  ORF Transcript_4851/g.5745 Transcript_4851/m.5745 type:complete len:152 (-) Transcript_4851:62-517(-)
MKATSSLAIAFVCVLLLGLTAAAENDPKLRRGQELIEWIEGDLEGTFIIMFYDHEAPASRTNAVRDQIQKEIMKPHPEFHYYEVDVLIDDFDKVTELCKINKLKVQHSPAVVIVSEGNGYWAHGQGVVEDIKFQLPIYSIDIRKQKGDWRR